MAGKDGDDKNPEAVPQLDSLTLTDLEQIRVLADPLRVRILAAFCDQERTTKQVAQLLEETPTKLYHHVDALNRVGLIQLTRTQQNRGTLEKYYRSVARNFQADSKLFSGPGVDSETTDELMAVAKSMLDQTFQEMQQAVRSEEGSESLTEQGLLSFVEIRSTPEHLAKIREKLRETLEELVAQGDEGGKDSEKFDRYRLTLAYFPIEKRK